MKRLLYILLFILIALPGWSQVFSYTYKGQTLNYYIPYEESRTVEIWQYNPGIEGDLEIPSTVYYNSEAYTVTGIDWLAFQNNQLLRSVTIPNTVTSIGQQAFDGCIGLTSITIPNSVVHIGAYAFMDCTGITSITIPNSVKTVDSDAFKGCNGLKEIIIEDSTETLEFGNDIFKGSSLSRLYLGRNFHEPDTWHPWIGLFRYPTLIEVTIGKNVTSIESKSFCGCSGLKNLIIVDSDEPIKLGYEAFKDAGIENLYLGRNILDCDPFSNDNLSKVSIGNSVTYINPWLFKDCTELTSISIPPSVSSIGRGAFKGCSALTSITIPTAQTSIENDTFNGCSSLTSITISNSVASIGEKAFYGCTGLTSLTILDHNDPLIIEAEAFNDAQIKTLYLGRNLFTESSNYKYGPFYKTTLEEVILGNQIKEISNAVFQGCTGLMSIELPNSVTSIGEHTFAGCSGLTSITLPSSINFIGDAAFSGCSSLTSITIPKNLTSIGNSTFYDCAALTSITVPESVTTIGSSAFSGCSGLTSINIPKAVNSIGTAAFYRCSGLTSITIPNTVTTINDRTFAACSGLTSIILPSSLTFIGESAFYACRGLSSISIPSSITTIAASTFSGCNGLTSVIIPNTVTSIGSGAFYGCSGLKDLTIDDGSETLELGDRVFSYCNTSTLYIGRNIKCTSGYLKDLPFNNSTISSLTIGNTVTSIGKLFYGCNGLKDITITDGDTWLDLDSDSFINQELHTLYLGRTVSGYKLFGGSSISKVTVGSSVSYIKEDTFLYTKLEEVYIVDCSESLDLRNSAFPNSVKKLYVGRSIQGDSSNSPNRAPFRSSYLSEVTISDNVTTIGDGVFAGCSGLSSIFIPNSVTSIGESAFYGCTGFSSINIPDSVTSIGSKAFKECTGLSSIIIPPSVTSIGSNAFEKCTELKELTFSDGSKPIELGTNVFSTTALDALYLGRTIICTSPYRVDLPFYSTSLSSVTIGDTVTTVGDNAFYGCSKLKDLTIADGKETIEFGKDVFTDCHLNKLYLGRNYSYSSASAGDAPFSNSSLTEVIISDSVTSISNNAFQSCTGLTSITIPGSVSSIGTAAFQSCSGLTSIAIPNSVTSIGAGAFNYCANLEKVEYEDLESTLKIEFAGIPWNSHPALWINGEEARNIIIPDSEDTIHDYSFSGYSNVESVSIPNSVSRVGKGAFYNCIGLTSVTIPNSVISIGDSAFGDCTALTTISIPNSVTSVGDYAFEGCSALTSVTLSNSLTTIGEQTFYECSRLQSIVIPNSVKNIGESAFEECTALKSVSIGKSVERIGQYAFAYCPNIDNVYYSAANPTNNASRNIFSNSAYSNATLWVRPENVELCKRISPWREFYFIEPYDFGNIDAEVSGLMLNTNALAINVNDSFNLIATVYPETASDKTVIWSSLNPEIATVDPGGLVTGIAEGETTIFASCRNVTTNCRVTVSSGEISGIDIIFDHQASVKVEIFDLNGRYVANNMENLSPGVYIVSDGENIKKIMVK